MSNWTKARLDEVCSLVTDGTHHSPPNSSSGAYRYVTAKNIRPWGLDLRDISYVDAKTHAEIYARCPVEKDDVLYIKDGVTTGLAAINHLDEPFSMLSSVALLKPRRNVLEPRYLKYWLNSPETFQNLTGEMTGSAIKRLVLRQIRSAEIDIAPFNEQNRIADQLDKLLARIQSCNNRLETIPALIKRFRQSVLAAAISGELTKEWRSSETQENWGADTLANLCHSVFDGDHQAPPQTDTGIPFITISAMNDGRLRLEKATRFVPLAYFDAQKPGRRPARGDVLFSVTGSIGISALIDVDEHFAFQRHIAILKPNHSKVSSEYLVAALGADSIRQQALAVATGTAQLTIPLSGLRSVVVPLPPPEEQAEIVRRLENLQNIADRIETRCAAARAHAQRLTPLTLAKAFRGELVPQDPNDEPASELLARIGARRGEVPSTKIRRSRTTATSDS